MTPELMKAGAQARAEHAKRIASSAGLSGGREVSYGRVVREGQLDVAHGAILYLDDITVSFDGFKALNALSLSISAGELRCIIGPNGAGKTTMMDVITGKTRPDAGRAYLRLDDRPAAPARKRDRGGRHRPQVPEAHRVRTAQRVPEPRTRAEGRPRRARLDAVSPERRAARPHRRDAELIHLKDSAQRIAGLLSHGQKQWLEIGMLLMQDPSCCCSISRWRA